MSQTLPPSFPLVAVIPLVTFWVEVIYVLPLVLRVTKEERGAGHAPPTSWDPFSPPELTISVTSQVDCFSSPFSTLSLAFYGL